MAFNSINDTEIEVGKPIKKSILQKVKDNFDDHEGRLNAIQVSSGIIDIFNDNIDHTTRAIGQIIASPLDITDFQTYNGDSWVLCDGQNVAGSAFALFAGTNNVPDLRNEFIRGASSTIPLGTQQSDATAVNGLTFGTTNYFAGSFSNSGITNQGIIDNQTISQVSSEELINQFNSGLGGDSETRPRNVAVNFFIKINADSLENRLIYRATTPFDITNVQATIVKMPGGTSLAQGFEIDIRTGSDLNSLNSIFASRPFTTVTSTIGQTGGFAIATGGEVVNAGDYVVFDIISLPSWNSRIHVYVTGSPN